MTYQRANGNGFNRLESKVKGGVDGWMEEEEEEVVGETGLDKYRLRAFLQVKKDDTQAVLPIAKVRVVSSPVKTVLLLNLLKIRGFCSY